MSDKKTPNIGENIDEECNSNIGDASSEMSSKDIEANEELEDLSGVCEEHNEQSWDSAADMKVE